MIYRRHTTYPAPMQQIFLISLTSVDCIAALMTELNMQIIDGRARVWKSSQRSWISKEMWILSL